MLNENLTPSVISVDENCGEIYVGKIAKERMISHPELTAAVFKRSMGTEKKYNLGNKEFLCEELSSFVLRSLKEDAEAFLKVPIEEAIISVPAYFNDEQRKATIRAGKLAGLKVERMISEPTAASIAYGIQNRKACSKFLVFDLGGGTFDVSILEMHNNIMEVRAVAGDNFLGGEDFTNVLLGLFLAKNNINISDLSKDTLAHVKKQAENAKINFSSAREVTMKCKINNEILENEISIDEYEKSCEILFTKIRKPIERALKDASIKVREIDEIILVGGATKLSCVRNFVAKLFGRIPNVNVNPDEAVALGAAIQGAMKERNKAISEMILTDVCPYTLGTNISVKRKKDDCYESGHFFPIIERNTVIPVSRTERLYTVYDNQSKISIEILQGESRFAKNNILLGEISVDVPKKPGGEEAIDVTYTYDINSILEVEVTVVSTCEKKRVIIKKENSLMTDEEIDKRFKELSEIKIHPRDKEDNKLLLARGERLFEESIGEVRRDIELFLRKFEDALDTQDNKIIGKTYKEVSDFFDEIEDVF